MSKLTVFFIITALSSLITCYLEKIRYMSTEHPSLTYYNRKYISYANYTAKRYGRANPFYYIGVNMDIIYEFHNNVTVDFYFYEFLTNRYRRGFVELHFKLCDLIEKDTFLGVALRQGRFAEQRCPFPAGVYQLNNMTVPLKSVPHNFPFTKGRVYVNISATVSKELISSAYIDMEIKQIRTNITNWVDIKN